VAVGRALKKGKPPDDVAKVLRAQEEEDDAPDSKDSPGI